VATSPGASRVPMAARWATSVLAVNG
jgi:hypothetical protein